VICESAHGLSRLRSLEKCFEASEVLLSGLQTAAEALLRTELRYQLHCIVVWSVALLRPVQAIVMII
jgi:hypothetical protein